MKKDWLADVRKLMKIIEYQNKITGPGMDYS